MAVSFPMSIMPPFRILDGNLRFPMRYPFGPLALSLSAAVSAPMVRAGDHKADSAVHSRPQAIANGMPSARETRGA